ncbi:hypothetical protein [Microlunatus speluncae]|uniref:hypothetical protein n=1 Tax=Microlunatus speluncae TaxID=2594267 RepID=UPI0012664641|nr:hypothetical protein [Microlunatus speluncae]
MSATTPPQPTPAAPATPPRPRRRRFFRVCLALLRILTLVHAALCIAQPITMGQYLAGNLDIITWHGVGGDGIVFIALLMIFVAVLYAIAGGRVWIAVVVPILFLVEGFQVGMGWSRQLGIHVPLGVGVVVASILLAIIVWLPRASRDRRSAVAAGSPADSGARS